MSVPILKDSVFNNENKYQLVPQASSNVYGNTIIPQTVPMAEFVVIVLELQCHVRIGTFFDSNE